jgi:hypothetical protein
VSEARNLDDTKQRVLVVGLGTMGLSHARAYRAIGGFDLAGLCTFDAAARHDLDQEFPGIPRYERLTEALQAHDPKCLSLQDAWRRGSPPYRRFQSSLTASRASKIERNSKDLFKHNFSVSFDVSPKRTLKLGPKLGPTLGPVSTANSRRKTEGSMARAMHKLTAIEAETISKPGRHSDGWPLPPDFE